MCNNHMFHIDYILTISDVDYNNYKLKMRRKKMVVIPPIGMRIAFGKFTATVKHIIAPISFDVITCNLESPSLYTLDDISEMMKMGWKVEERIGD